MVFISQKHNKTKTLFLSFLLLGLFLLTTDLVAAQIIPPSINTGPDATVNEGSLFTQVGSFDDPDSSDWIGEVDYGEGAGFESLAINGPAKTFTLAHTYADNAQRVIIVKMADFEGNQADPRSLTVQVINVAPTVNVGPDQVVSVGVPFVLSAVTFSDPGFDNAIAGTNEDFTSIIDWGDSSSELGVLVEIPGSVGVLTTGDLIPAVHTYLFPGIFTLTVIVEDDDAGQSIDTATITVVLDTDADGIPDPTDNCPLAPNPDQADLDSDGLGDVCDNCPFAPNIDQVDTDDDAIGDACDSDDDNDGVIDTADNCPTSPNTDQADLDSDGLGNVCDNCAAMPNPTQTDTNNNGIGDVCEPDVDGDGIGDAADNCPFAPDTAQTDDDNDGVGNVCDNCPNIDNPAQTDTNNNGIGDVCDDPDSDGFPDSIDNCPLILNPDQADLDSDGLGDVCDNCAVMPNPSQTDANNNGIGDACEPDGDADGIGDAADNCPTAPNTDQADADTDNVGNVCDVQTCGNDLTEAPNSGDGFSLNEQCDDGNVVSNDGCSATCQLEDADSDGFPDNIDNCPLISNPSQEDLDNDGIGDVCDPDKDNDGVLNPADNCPLVLNADQVNTDSDTLGDVCDPDIDNDGVLNANDASQLNPDICEDTDSDTCDDCSVGTDNFGPLADNDPANDGADLDNDGICDLGDPQTCGNNVVETGEQCDDGNVVSNDGCSATCQLEDADSDGTIDTLDNCPTDANPDQSDVDNDSKGDVCDVCPADATDTCDVNKTASESINDSGGTVTTNDGSVSMTIPEGALDNATSISISDNGTAFELTTNLGQAIGVFGVNIQPEGTTFNVPITITFTWDDADNDGTVDGTNIKEDNLLISKDNVAITGKCKSEPGCDTTANTFTFNVTSLSIFVLASLKADLVCNSTITESTTLIGDATCSGTGIIIGADNIIVDCAGHTLTGSGVFFGVLAQNKNNLTVKNCILENFSEGIRLTATTQSTVLNNTALNSVGGIRLSGSFNTITENTVDGNIGGMFVDGDSNVISNNLASNSDGGGFIFTGNANTYTSNIATNNNANGFILTSSSSLNTFNANTANNNQNGFTLSVASNNVLTANTAINNSQRGFTIQSNSNNNTISNNIAIDNTFNGFELFNSSANMITANTAEGSSAGFILTFTSNDNILINNNATKNFNGIRLDASHTNTLIANIADDNTNGFTLSSSATANILTSNTAQNNKKGFALFSSSFNTLDGNTAKDNDPITSGRGFLLDGSHNNTLTNNLAQNNREGFHLEAADDNVLINNIAEENPNFGFKLSGSSRNILSNNQAPNQRIGFVLQTNCNSNTFMNNTANNNDEFGFFLSGAFTPSSNNVLDSNTANNNGISGLGLFNDFNFNTLTNNVAKNHLGSFDSGISLSGVNNNTLTSNIMENNFFGISISPNTNDNLIYNNFFNNTKNAADFGSINIWNIPKTAGANIIGGSFLGGNFWSDYTGVDTNGDGLGDTLVPHNSTGIELGGDFLPLTNESIIDTDNDGIEDGIDNCPTAPNTDQADADTDNVGNVCDVQTCGNGIIEAPNSGDGFSLNEQCDDGNVVSNDGCSATCQLEDADSDGTIDTLDNCPTDANPDQSDVDNDSKGDVCDVCPADATDTCDVNKTASESINDSGGTVTTNDGSVSMTFPEGALDNATSISVTDNGTTFELTSNLGASVGIFGVDIEPDGTIFNVPVTLVFSWDDADNDGTVDGTSIKEGNLLISKDNVAITGKCKSEPGCDTTANTFTFNITSLSIFVLLGPLDTDNDGIPDDFDGVVDLCPSEDATGLDANQDGCKDTIESLINTTQGLNLKQGITNSLDKKLQNARDALTAAKANKRQDAINKLNAFKNEVNAQRDKALTNDQATLLIAMTNNIITQLT